MPEHYHERHKMKEVLEFLALYQKESTIAFVLVPIVWGLLYNAARNSRVLNEELITTLREWFQGMEDAIKDHDEKTERHFIRQAQSAGNTVLTAEQTVHVLESSMWLVSTSKIEFLEGLMKANHIEGRRAEITERITNELAAHSERYMKVFREFITPVGDLDRWLDEKFGPQQFAAFVEKIVDIVYSNKYDTLSKDYAVQLRSKEIATHMKTIQRQLAQDLRKAMAEHEA